MNDLENRLDRASSGEYRLNPDEQKLYLNTFRERVLLAIDFSDAQNPQLKAQFDKILSQFDGKYDPIFVKISGNLSDDLTGFYLKTTTEHQFVGQILAETAADVYGLIVHTDHAVNLEKIDLTDVLPNILSPETPSEPVKKKGFLSKLFG
jgi:uncharacterized protein YueI